MIAKVFVFPNGNCMVFDEKGQQLSEYQGLWTEKREAILRDRTPHTTIEDASWHGWKANPIHVIGPKALAFFLVAALSMGAVAHAQVPKENRLVLSPGQAAAILAPGAFGHRPPAEPIVPKEGETWLRPIIGMAGGGYCGCGTYYGSGARLNRAASSFRAIDFSGLDRVGSRAYRSGGLGSYAPTYRQPTQHVGAQLGRGAR